MIDSRALGALVLIAASVSAKPPGHQPPRVAVLSIALNNLHKTPPDPDLAGRILDLADALRTRLADACGYEVVTIEAAGRMASRLADGYFYEHPEVATGFARAEGADWVVIPRLNRASAWVADLQAHVVGVRDTALVSNRIVELKGLELGPDLAARLTDRGAAWMADQISQVIEVARQPATPVVRRCAP